MKDRVFSFHYSNARTAGVKSGAIAAVALIQLFGSAAMADSATRSWRIEDSLQTRYFSGIMDVPYFWPRPDEGQLVLKFIVWSPDRKHFFYLTHRGVLERDSNLFELTVYSADAVRRSLTHLNGPVPVPTAKVTYESTSSRLPGISNAQWEVDGKAIIFKAMTDSGQLELHRLDVESGAVRRLTDVRDEFMELAARRLGSLVARAIKVSTPVSEYPVRVPERNFMGGPMEREPTPRFERELLVSYDGSTRKIEGAFDRGWIAPDGKAAVAIEVVNDKRRFVLLNLERGERSAFTSENAFVGISANSTLSRDARVKLAKPSVLWLESGEHALLIGAVPSGQGSLTDAEAPWIVDYDRVSQRLRNVDSMILRSANGTEGYIAAVASNSAHSQLNITLDSGLRNGGQKRRCYQLRGDAWQVHAVCADTGRAASSKKDINVVVRESINDPPVVMASLGHTERVIVPADPAMNQVRRAVVEPIQWRELNGRVSMGSYILPSHASKHPLPLVVQVVSHASLKFFLPDGPVSAAYAAQVYAAMGFAVLQVPSIKIYDAKDGRRIAEGPEIVSSLSAAIGSLSAQVPIDLSKVALIGHSRAGYQVFYAITHPDRIRYAAAVVVDSRSGSYSAYLQTGSFAPWTKEGMEDFNRRYDLTAGGSFWERKADWLADEPTFNIDRCQTPALFTLHGSLPSSKLGVVSWDVIGAFNLNNKPLEYLWFPSGEHTLVRPRERLELLGTTVDWLNLWLKDRSPNDEGRALRWSRLKQQQREQLSRSAGNLPW